MPPQSLMNPTDDPDDTPTRFRGDPPPDPAGSGGGEDRTVPSMDAAGKAPPPPPKPGKPSDPLVGKQLGGCRIDGLLGRGAMGAVYRARQLRLDRDVAVKVIRPEMMTDPRTLKRFEVEARTVGRFHTQHVVMVHDVGFEAGVHFLIMELVQGKNLRDHVKLLGGGRLPAAEAIPLLRQACKGLEEAQRLGVIHRDVKPDNLMLTDRGVLKIADFGIAKPVENDFSMTLTSELIGTPLYMSPEQCQGAADLDFRSDMYSLGATFYYLLTGEPPVRASSVYELIQTKTKLENLCLWKALPELDQNHPLSRVIERMTALDREDRYPTYEALLGDISLVEQGGTIQRLERQPKQPTGALPKLVAKGPQKSRAPLFAGVGVLALALAGGGWWLANGGAGGGADGGGGVGRTVVVPDTTTQTDPETGAVVLDPAAVAARLAALRGQLAASGPSDGLQGSLAALAVDPSHAAARDALRADVEQGLAVQARLAGLVAPTALALPFDDLRAHFAAVEAATRLDASAGEELRAWVAARGTEARAERVLAAEAKSKLLGAFAKWQQDRHSAGDEAALVQLGERLAVLDAGREQLLALLPRLQPEVDTVVSQDALDTARVGLKEKTVSPVDVDVGAALAAITAEFERDGPSDALADRTSKLTPTKADQLAARDRLRNAIGRAMDSRRDAERAYTDRRPQDPQLPFDDVADYYTQIDRALQPLRGDDDALAPWAEALRTRVRAEPELQAKALAACRAAFEAWQRDSRADSAVVTRLETSLQSLARGVARAAELFPGARAEFDLVVPADALATARQRLELVQQRKDLLAAVPRLVAELDRVRSITDWRSRRAAWLEDLAQVERQAAAFAGDAAVEAELRDATQLRDRWEQASARVDEFATRFAAGDLTGARSTTDQSVVGSEGRDELRLLGGVTAKAVEAFAVLDRELDVDRAVTSLEDATTLLRDHAGLAPAAVERLKSWTDRLVELRDATRKMVAIPAGSTKSGPVAAFFLGCTEVSQAEYTRFLDELHAAVGALDGEARAAALRERFGDLELPERVVRNMLSRRGRLLEPNLPVDDTNWFEAAAFARWYGMSLPTKAEWTLAALGDNGAYTYPWGNEWRRDDENYNIGSALVPVTSGGRSWRSGGGKAVHHLAGNAAEWLARENDRNVAFLAGGRCQDPLGELKRRASGEDFHEASLEKSLHGFGFRVVLRPRAFLGSEFPTGRLR